MRKQNQVTYFITDENGRMLYVTPDDFWDGLISELRRNEEGIPLAQIKADLIDRVRLR